MADSPTRTLVCSVLFLDIAEYSKKGVSEQQQAKDEFNRVLSAALEQVAPRDRVVIDTGDGAAVTFFGDPENVLSVVIAIRDNLGELPVRMGVNLGPVRMVQDLNGQVTIIGDGINSAQRVMSFAAPGQLLVSHSYYEVVSRLADDLAALFRYEGSKTDKHVREHDVYSVSRKAVPARAGDATGATAKRAQAFDLSRPGGQAPDDSASRRPAQVYDAGGNIIVSGYSRSSVEEELKKLIDSGYRVQSPVNLVGIKWVASCEHSTRSMSACKVEEMGFTRIVTGPSRKAVTAKVDELLQYGSVLVGSIECTNGVWTAVCDAGETRR